MGEAYGAAQSGPADIDTGVVILTGEALRRENSQAIASLIAEKGGDFVCAGAGHHMESMLAAYGSGAAGVSGGGGKRILNIDNRGRTPQPRPLQDGKGPPTPPVPVRRPVPVRGAARAPRPPRPP